eukprot:TRINITY_DN2723_c0_g2_i1.p1 TRINITY_DN2723_c0_g2~~TRINITY_DN2723_c0_g2_i1.p1  ORF type:complete len:450 (+),score=98.59 TRINITY_DN2723_c0_g2_i1:41-1390(+)
MGEISFMQRFTIAFLVVGLVLQGGALRVLKSYKELEKPETDQANWNVIPEGVQKASVCAPRDFSVLGGIVPGSKLDQLKFWKEFPVPSNNAGLRISFESWTLTNTGKFKPMCTRDPASSVAYKGKAQPPVEGRTTIYVPVQKSEKYNLTLALRTQGTRISVRGMGVRNMLVEILGCHVSCKTCKSTDECDTCPAKAITVKKGEETICECEKDKRTLTSDPLECAEPCNPNCKTCKGHEIDVCTSCFEPSVLKNNQCVCPPRYFKESDRPIKCQKCHLDCVECQGPANDQCTTCTTNAQLAGGACICKDGFYKKSEKPLVCAKLEKCHDTCKTCSGPSENECLTCPENAELIEDKKGKHCECKKGYYEEKKIPLVCKKIPCHYSCKLCGGPEEDNCIECWQNGSLIDTDDADAKKTRTGKKCDCEPPNILWSTTPYYICNTQYVKYEELN